MAELHPVTQALIRRTIGKVRKPQLSLDATLEKLQANYATRHGKVRLLGHQESGLPVLLSEEDREHHIHILGSPGEGKSKFLELLIRGDIEKGYGACLIDPGERGDTTLRLLNYCAKVGFKKVVYISPAQWYSRVPVIQPLRTDKFHTASIGGITDALAILWNTRDVETPRIQRYLPAVLHALHAAGLTLAEVSWFMSKEKQGPFKNAQVRVLDHLPYTSLSRRYLEQALFGNAMEYRDFQSTINRFNVLADPTLRLFVGSKLPPLPWDRFVKEGWLVLVNLDGARVWETDTIYSRLIGTLIINEISKTVSTMFTKSQGKNFRPFYLYLDEAGQFMTPKIKLMLDLKRKTPLKLALSHQYFSQIEDLSIQASVRTSAKIKVMFRTSNVHDRRLMMSDMGYGGELPDRSVAYVLGGLKKGTAAISIGIKPPRITEIAEVPDVEVKPQILKSFLDDVYSQEWYHPRKEVETEINDRFNGTQLYSAPAGYATKRTSKPKAEAGKKANPRGAVESAGGQSQQKENPGVADAGGVHHNSPRRPPLLRR